jgi:hypothetical protein
MSPYVFHAVDVPAPSNRTASSLSAVTTKLATTKRRTRATRLVWPRIRHPSRARVAAPGRRGD